MTALQGLQACIQASKSTITYVNGWGLGLSTSSTGRKMLQTAQDCAEAAAISSAIRELLIYVCNSIRNVDACIHVLLGLHAPFNLKCQSAQAAYGIHAVVTNFALLSITCLLFSYALVCNVILLRIGAVSAPG